MKKYKKENERNRNATEKDRKAKTVLQRKIAIEWQKQNKKKEDIVEKRKRNIEAVKIRQRVNERWIIKILKKLNLC